MERSLPIGGWLAASLVLSLKLIWAHTPGLTPTPTTTRAGLRIEQMRELSAVAQS